MKKILGLDLGTNSIGWALINYDFDNEKGEIINMGSRIVPMSSDLIKDFEQGNSISRTRSRTLARGARRLKQRYQLRRERLIKTLKILGWVPETFPERFEGVNQHNINDYLPFDEQNITECAQQLKVDKSSLPQDWVIYYLRKKALTEKISLQELARVIYHFNQRRGFKSNRKSNDDSTVNIDEIDTGIEKPKNENRIEILKVVSVIETGETKFNKKIYSIVTSKAITENIFEGTILRESIPEWENTEQELEVRIKRSKQGTRIEFAIPDKSEWKKSKEALEKEIIEIEKHPGEYFFDQIKSNPNYKIKQRILDRKFYITEIEKIWKTQKEFHPELNDTKYLPEIATSLYNQNLQKQKEIRSNDLFHVIVNDIIYYHRDLKSQKASIGHCRFEKKNVTITGKENTEFSPNLKVAPVSSPAFQTFRIWKTIHNLKVFALQKTINGKIHVDFDETDFYFNNVTKEELFDKFNEKEQLKVSDLYKMLGISPKAFRFNFPDETILKGNETKHFFRKAFKKLGYKDGFPILEDESKFEQIWHLLYSVNEPNAIAKSLVKRFDMPENVGNTLSILPPFPSNYSAYSQKALKKMTQLMCCGKYWSFDKINSLTQNRINKLIDGEEDESISLELRKRLSILKEKDDYQGLAEYLASYVVYGKHSEQEGEMVNKPSEIKAPKQNSLRNPIVEQIVNETMELTKAIWQEYGRPEEIRVEMARDMSRTAKEREKVSRTRDKNRDDKLRIKAIIKELKTGNPDSIADLEKLRLLEENGNFRQKNNEASFFKKSTEPTPAEIAKYRLWIEQNCVSPYTGKPIILSRLFKRDYEVEHIIPKSRYYDDSFNNKVIVEAWANDEKGNKTAMQYLRDGSAVGNLLSIDDYIAHVNKLFFGKKRSNLLSDTIPEGFIERQKNDTRYITTKVVEYLSQVVDKNKVRITTGNITNELKQKWGLNEVMKKLLVDRFERLEEITGEKLITYETTEGGQRKIHLKGYEKRIDHRHHALDALITACTTNRHVQYLNTLHAQSDPAIKHKFRILLKSEKTRDFKLPWKTFVNDTKNGLEKIIVSHKNRNRILNQGINRYYKYIFNNGRWEKKISTQNEKGLFSIRQPLHKETISGKIKLRRYKSVNLNEAINNIDYIADKRIKNALKQLVNENAGNIAKIKKELKISPLLDRDNNVVTNKIQIWYFEEFAVSREKLNDSFTEKKIKEKVAEYDTNKPIGIKHLLLSHLKEFDNNPKQAFKGEGLEILRKKAKHPITTISTYEIIGKKFEVRPNQLVETAKGTNLFFVIYENIETCERDYETLSFEEVVAAKMNKLPIVKEKEGFRHFTLSPHDLVYVPDPEENVKIINWNKTDSFTSKKIYKVVSSTGKECHFVPHNFSRVILPKIELGSLNKSERTINGTMIKTCCIKLKHDKLGNIKPF